MRIHVCSGYWSQNIGNAFFQLGGKALLERASEPDDEVGFMPDHPGNWTLVSKAKGGPPNALDALEWWQPDVVVIQGPSLRKGFDSMWTDSLVQHKKRGGKVLLLGIGLFKFDDYERSLAARLAKTGLIDFAVSRDSRTYEALSDAGIPSYSGIDSAFFVPWAYTPTRLPEHRNYVTVNFDRFAEPGLSVDNPSGADHSYDTSLGSVNFSRRHRLDRAAKYGHMASYAMQSFAPSAENKDVAGYPIVRVSNRANPPIHHINYRSPQSFVADEPLAYLDIFGNSRLTISDRVHSVVTTLAYGGEAIFFNDTPRASLLSEVGCTFDQGSQVLDGETIEKRRADELRVLKDFLGSLRS